MSTHSYDLDLIVFIGRFQIPHHSHQQIFETALRGARHVLILVGSSNVTRSIKNPFTFAERKVMIESSLSKHLSRVTIQPLSDYPYMESMWLKGVQEKAQHTAEITQTDPKRIGIIGHLKDATSYYIKSFPQWRRLLLPNFDGRSATELRTLLLSPAMQGHGNEMMLRASVPEPVFDFLQAFRQMPQYANLVEEYEFIRTYREPYEALPHKPIFVTVDAVVTMAGHILVTERQASYGKGQLALPGSFLQSGERFHEAVMRVLRDEKRLKIPEPVLRSAIAAAPVRVIDDPNRSLRGHTVTHAYHLDLQGDTLAEVRAGRNTSRPSWMSMADFYALDGRMFEDHWHIPPLFLGMA